MKFVSARSSCLVLAIFLLSIAFPAQSATAVAPCYAVDCINLPADSGMINVKDFGATGNGVTDDTAAINAALMAGDSEVEGIFGKSRIVYLPIGTYLVSAPLYKSHGDGSFSNGLILMGQSRQATIIKLRDGAAGYQDAANPRAVILTTAERSYSNTVLKGVTADATAGEGLTAYTNFIENLTIDAGGNNPGAIGIDYLANQFGAVRNVTLRAGADSGKIGIRMLRKWAGPSFLQNVIVQGFNIGVAVRNADLSVTIDKLTLNDQRQWGLYNNNSLVSIRALRANNVLTPVVNSGAKSLIFLNGGAFYHTNGVNSDIITNSGSMNIRNLGMRGYGLLFGRTPDFSSGDISASEGTFEGNVKTGSAFQTWSSLPVDPPAPPNTVSSQWGSVAAPAIGMATEAIRAAMASGANTIYFPHGLYRIDENIVIPSTVQRIVGMNATIKAVGSGSLDLAQSLFRTANNANALTIEKLNFIREGLDDLNMLEHAGTQPLVLRDITMGGKPSVFRGAGAGTVFVENFSGGRFVLEGAGAAWMRQINTQSADGTCISNKDGLLWVQGLKSEGQCTVVANSGAGRAEIMGALIHANTDSPDPNIPAFKNANGKMLVSYIEDTFDNTGGYGLHFLNTLSGVTKSVPASALPERDSGRQVTQLVSSNLQAAATSSASSPSNPEITGSVFGDYFGINIKTEFITKPELDLIAALGIRRVRIGVSWYGVETSLGKYRWDIRLPRRGDADDYGAKTYYTYDEMVAAIRERKIKLDVTLHEGNAAITGLVNMAPAGKPPSYRHIAPRTPEHIAAFANFAAATVRHFEGIHGKGNFGWHIWNEPDTNMGYPPYTDAGIVGQLVTESCRAIRKVSPDTSVMGPAMSAYGDGDIRLDFITGLFSRSNPLSCIDALTIHPYRAAVPETAPATYAQVMQRMAPWQPAGKTVPVAADEWGYSINKNYTLIGSQAWRSRTQEEQAALMFRIYLTNLKAGLPLTVIYDWRDNGTDPYDWEHHFGVIGYDGQEKAPLRMFRHVWAALLDRMVQEAGTPKGCGTHEHMMRFGSRANDPDAGWTVLWSDATSPRTIYIQGKVEKITNIFGTEIAPTATGNGISLTINGYPRLVRHAKGGKNPLTLSCTAP